MDFHYSIKYKTGKNNQDVDVVSRSFHLALLIIHYSFINEVKNAIASSSSFQELLQKFHSHPFFHVILHIQIWITILETVTSNSCSISQISH